MEVECPDKYLCPITMDLMIEPVKASDNKIYEKDAITDWLKKNNESPITREILSKNLIIQDELKDEIEIYRKKFNLKTKPYSPKNVEENFEDNVSEENNILEFDCVYCNYPVEICQDISNINCNYCLGKYLLIQCKDCNYSHVILKKRRGNFYCRNCTALNVFYHTR